MTNPIRISNAIRNAIVFTLASGFVALIVFSFAATTSWLGRPFPGFLVMQNRFVAVLWLPEWEGFQRGIKFGDVVERVNGTPVSNGDEINAMVSSLEPGTPVNYSINRGGREMELSIPVDRFSGADYFIIFIICIAAGGAFFIVGLIVFYLRPNLAASRSFLFLCLAGGISFAAAPEHCTNHANSLMLKTLPLIGPSFLLVGCYFPVVSSIRRYLLAYAAVSSGAIIFLYNYFFMDPALFRVLDAVHNGNMVITGSIGTYLMVRSFNSSADAAARQKSKMVIYGLVTAFLAGATIIVGTVLFSKISFFWGLPFLAAIPFSMGYAIVANNLFDVDVFIRRSAGYIIVSGLVAAIFFLLIGALSVLLNKFTGQSSQLAAIVSTIVVMALFRPMHNRIDGFLDRRFFRDAHEYQQTIRKASAVLVSIVELQPLLDRILEVTIESMKIERGLIMLLDPIEGVLKPVASLGHGTDAGLPDLAPDHPLPARLESKRRPFQLRYGSEDGEQRDDILKCIEAMNDYKAALAVPVPYEDKIIGALFLGEKKSGGLYSSEDIELLETLMLQTAVSIENARKVEELKSMIELETSYRELQRVNELKDNLLHMVSHDLRTPMTGIMGYAYVLFDRLEQLKPEAQKEYLSIIIKEGERLTRLINDLLDLQRFEAGRISLEFEEVDVTELTLDCVNVFTAAAEAKNVELGEIAPTGPVMVKGHRDRLAQVLSNLASNAVKFTPQGGSVAVGTKIIPGPDGGHRVKVFVRDNGKGIPAEELPFVFDKFHQAHKEQRDKGEGSGLGLALAKEIIDYHKGEIGAESEPGRGSEFYFILDVLEAPP